MFRSCRFPYIKLSFVRFARQVGRHATGFRNFSQVLLLLRRGSVHSSRPSPPWRAPQVHGSEVCFLPRHGRPFAGLKCNQSAGEDCAGDFGLGGSHRTCEGWKSSGMSGSNILGDCSICFDQLGGRDKDTVALLCGGCLHSHSSASP